MEIKTIDIELASLTAFASSARAWRRIRRRIRRLRQQAKRKPESVPVLVNNITAEQFRLYQCLCVEQFGLGEKK